MKYFIGLILITAVFSACAATETSQDNDLDAIAETERSDNRTPEWFNRTVSSSSDSTEFNGYSHAVAVEHADASRLSEETAITNLRFEIDRFTEEVRQELEDSAGSERYSSGRFIINLRNSVQDLSLEDAERITDFREQDGFYEVFTRAVLSREEVILKLSALVNDDEFSRALNSHRVL
jgi:hypothetical protein